MKAMTCSCGCGSRLTRKASRGNSGKRGRMRFYPGHNQARSESTESRSLQIHRARQGRRPPAVRLYEGRVPTRIRPRTIHYEL
jgi:hypothetical protein